MGHPQGSGGRQQRPDAAAGSPAADGGQSDDSSVPSVSSPSHAIRLAAMTQALLAQVRDLDLDDAARQRLSSVHNTTVEELRGLLSEPLRSEVERLELSLPDEPTDAELRVAQAQLVGWLEGLFHGIRSTMVAHQLASQEQLSQIQQRGLPGGEDDPRRPGGQYL